MLTRPLSICGLKCMLDIITSYDLVFSNACSHSSFQSALSIACWIVQPWIVSCSPIHAHTASLNLLSKLHASLQAPCATPCTPMNALTASHHCAPSSSSCPLLCLLNQRQVLERKEEKICDRVMYDDVNETFWSVDGVHALLPTGCAHESGKLRMFGSASNSSWRRFPSPLPSFH